PFYPVIHHSSENYFQQDHVQSIVNQNQLISASPSFHAPACLQGIHNLLELPGNIERIPFVSVKY
ncbi:MAG: hypothetical protein ACOC0T_03795, partial [Desulfovermiculus sp.]